jgi:hypothetical protein
LTKVVKASTKSGRFDDFHGSGHSGRLRTVTAVV